MQIIDPIPGQTHPMEPSIEDANIAKQLAKIAKQLAKIAKQLAEESNQTGKNKRSKDAEQPENSEVFPISMPFVIPKPTTPPI